MPFSHRSLVCLCLPFLVLLVVSTTALPAGETVDPEKPPTDATMDLLSATIGCRD